MAKRIVSALVILPVALLAVWLGGVVFAAFLALLAVLGAFEWGAISGCQQRTPRIILAVLVPVAAVVLYSYPAPMGFAALGGAFVIAAAVSMSAGRASALIVGLGAVYMAVSFCAAGYIRLGPNGLALFLWLCAMVVATDVGAYIAGKTIGGAKLAPRISPNKTWAGLIGGMVASGVASGLFAWFMGQSYLLSVLIGCTVTIAAQSGDLLESWLKRRAGLKDSSQLIPGHGGVLDRLDGFLAATLWFYLLSSFYSNGFQFHG